MSDDALRAIERHCIDGGHALVLPDSHPDQDCLDHELSFEDGTWHLSRFCKKDGGVGYEWRAIFTAATLPAVLAEANRVGALAPTGKRAG